jgi:hypothetical protein
VSKAIEHLRPSNCVGLDGIPSFIIKGCSDVFILLLTLIFNLNITSATFPTLWKQTAVVPVFKKKKKKMTAPILKTTDPFLF